MAWQKSIGILALSFCIYKQYHTIEHYILVKFALNHTGSMSTYKFYYFDGRGRGEISRLILTVAEQKFEDVRYSVQEWPSHKSEMPLGQMPVLEVDGVKLAQSMTIARFLARKFHLAGKDDLEQAKVECVADTATDLLNKIGPIIWYQEGDEKQASLNEFFANELPKHLNNLQTLANAYSEGGPFFVGNHLTMADLYVYDVLENSLEIDANILDKYSWLKINRNEVAKNPKLAKYLEKRPKTDF